MLLWLIPCGVGVFALTIYLFSLGSKGNEIAELLSLPVGLLSILATFAVVVLQGRNRNGAQPDTPRSRPWPLWVAIAVTVLIGLGGAGSYWIFGDRTPINVTADMAVEGIGPLYHEGTMTLAVPGMPPGRQKLAITLVLTNPASTGNCVRPARIELIPFLDGEAHSSIEARSGVEVEIPIRATREAKIVLILHQPDSTCGVNVHVDRALLYN